MPSGGARSRSGPPPDPQALRRNRPDDAATWVTLPAEGRLGDTPEFPGSPTDDELELWAELWTMPQAIEWDRLRLHREVALYCRSYVHAMTTADVKATDRTLVRQLADSLGLNTAGMARNRWRIGIVASDDAGETPAEAEDNVRNLFRAADGAA